MRWAALIGAVTVIVPAVAFPLEFPPADSRAAVHMQVGAALERVERLNLPSLQAVIRQSREACAGIRWSSEACTRDGVGRCEAGLAALFDRVQEARAAADPLIDASLARGLADIGGALSLLAHLPLAGGGCATRLSAGGTHAASLSPTPDLRFVEVQPLIPLRAGRRYWVVLDGQPARWADAGVEPEPVSPRETGAAGTGFAASLGGVDSARVDGFLESMAKALGDPPGTAGFAGVRLKLPSRLGGGDMAGLRASFVPLRVNEPTAAVASIATGDPRVGLRDYRRRLRSTACRSEATPLAARPPPTGAPPGSTSFHGRYGSLDIGASRDRAGPLGLPAAEASDVELDFRLVLPPGFSPTTPLVLALDGHMGSVDRMFERHAAELLAEGLAVVGIDLPDHGARAHLGRDFLTSFDPARLSRNMRQAATDVMALVRYAVDCGFPLGDDVTYRPSRVRFLGYSLGAMVGSIVRAVEPDLGTTSLVAPGGDMIGWLMLRLGPDLGTQYVTCMGGPEHGATCIEDGRCEAPGICVDDPFYELLYQRIELHYSLTSGPGDPLSFANERTGEASKAPLLLITGGEDPALHPALAARLADAYGMRVTGPFERRGPRSHYVQWPALGHDLPDHAGPRRQAHHFLATEGRQVLPTQIEKASEKPAWYSVFAPHRDRR